MFSLKNYIDVSSFDPKEKFDGMRVYWHNGGKDYTMLVMGKNFPEFIRRVKEMGPPDEITFQKQNFRQGSRQ